MKTKTYKKSKTLGGKMGNKNFDLSVLREYLNREVADIRSAEKEMKSIARDVKNEPAFLRSELADLKKTYDQEVREAKASSLETMRDHNRDLDDLLRQVKKGKRRIEALTNEIARRRSQK